MHAEWKVRTAGDLNGDSVLIVKIRTEHELVLTKQSLPRVVQAVSSLNQLEGLPPDEVLTVTETFDSIIALFHEAADGPPLRVGLESDWRPFPAAINLDVLKHLDEKTRDLETLRFEGSPETGYRFITSAGLTVGTRAIRTSAEARAFADEVESIKTEYVAATAALGGLAGAAIAGAAALGAAAVTAEKVFDALTAHERWVEQREKARKAKAEADAAEAAAKAEAARHDCTGKVSIADRETNRVGGGAGGGLERAIGDRVYGR